MAVEKVGFMHNWLTHCSADSLGVCSISGVASSFFTFSNSILLSPQKPSSRPLSTLTVRPLCAIICSSLCEVKDLWIIRAQMCYNCFVDNGAVEMMHKYLLPGSDHVSLGSSPCLRGTKNESTKIITRFLNSIFVSGCSCYSVPVVYLKKNKMNILESWPDRFF